MRNKLYLVEVTTTLRDAGDFDAHNHIAVMADSVAEAEDLAYAKEAKAVGDDGSDDCMRSVSVGKAHRVPRGMAMSFIYEVFDV